MQSLIIMQHFSTQIIDFYILISLDHIALGIKTNIISNLVISLVP